MKIILKIFSIIFINIFVFLLLFFISDVITYNIYKNIFEKDKVSQYTKFGYHFKISEYTANLKDFFNGSNNIYMGRKPDGLEYKNKTPIVVFGCSFAYGQYLNFNQTFSYKLAHILKRPVYNRAISGGGFQFMYFQVVDFGNKHFFNDIPNTDTAIYILVDDHYKRLMRNYFYVLSPWPLMTYSYKNGKFKINNNRFINFFKSIYISKYLNLVYTDNYINNPKHSEILTDMIVRYFELTKEKLEEHYNKPINFYIILYESWDISYKELLIKKLKNKGFIVITTSELTNEDLNSPKYMMQDNLHPTEAAWDLLTPLIAQKIKENK